MEVTSERMQYATVSASNMRKNASKSWLETEIVLTRETHT